VAALLEEAEEDLLAFYSFPADHWAKLRSINPLERVNRETGRRTDVVGIFPNDRSLIRLAASIIIEQNDEWLVGRRYLSAHSLEAVLDREKKSQTERRPESSPRPEQPMILPTSYTTSWDLTAASAGGPLDCGARFSARRAGRSPSRTRTARSAGWRLGRPARCASRPGRSVVPRSPGEVVNDHLPVGERLAGNAVQV
jgi:Transposase, Mutator family